MWSFCWCWSLCWSTYRLMSSSQKQHRAKAKVKRFRLVSSTLPELFFHCTPFPRCSKKKWSLLDSVNRHRWWRDGDVSSIHNLSWCRIVSFFVDLEVIDVADGCEAGKDFRHLCKTCKCQDDGTKAECPKWIKCCTVGETWSTNSCNTCECSEKFERICYAIECVKSRFRRRRRWSWRWIKSKSERLTRFTIFFSLNLN